MKKFLLILVALATTGLARAQGWPMSLDSLHLPPNVSATQVQYWFDHDLAHIHSMGMSTDSTAMSTIDVSDISSGLHLVTFQPIDSVGGCYPSSSTWFVNKIYMSDDTATLRCYFDGELSSYRLSPINNIGVATIDVSDLSSGLHSINLHYCRGDETTVTYSSYFVSIHYMDSDTLTLEYWFDQSDIRQRVDFNAGIANVDANGISSGLHLLNYRVLRGDAVTMAQSAFFVNEKSLSSGAMIEYWFDNSSSHSQLALSEGTATISAAGLSQGLHTLNYRFRQDDAVSVMHSALFDRVDNDIVTLYYAFDTSHAYQPVVFDAGGGAVLDASALAEGNHLLNLMAQGSYGTYTPVDTGSFERFVCSSSSMTTETVAACDSFYWYGTTYTVSTNMPMHTELNAQGCDSVIMLDLTIHYSSHETIYDTAQGSYEWEGETFTESCEYTVYYQTVDGCDSTRTLVLTIIGGEGIASVAGESITAYPNPTTGHLTLDASDVATVAVYDQAGRLVTTFYNTNQINLSDLPTGLYVLRVTLPSGNRIQRVVKQ